MARRGPSFVARFCRLAVPLDPRSGSVTAVGVGGLLLVATLIVGAWSASAFRLADAPSAGSPASPEAFPVASPQVIDSVAVYGPRDFIAGPVGSPALHVESFSLSVNPAARYSLVVRNGEVDGSGQVASMVLTLNGDTLLHEPAFGSPSTRIVPDVPVVGQNDLVLELEGPTDSFVQVTLFQSRVSGYVIFGPQEYQRTTGQPQPVDVTFSGAGAAPPFHMYVASGWPDGADRVTSGVIALNTVELFGSGDFGQSVGTLDAPVDVLESNELHVQLSGVPDSRLSIYITGTDTAPPVLSLTSPNDSTVTAETHIVVEGSVTDATAVQVESGGSLSAVNQGGTFSLEVALPTEGENTINVTATDAAGNQSVASLTVIRDTEPPVVTITDPTEGLVAGQTSIPVTGVVTDQTAVTLTIDGLAVEVGVAGGFSGTASVDEGTDLITVSATDAAGNMTVETRTVTVDLTPPVLSITEPADGTTTAAAEIQVAGTVTDATAVTLTVAGQAVAVDGGGGFQATVPLQDGPNAIAVVATDAAGNQATVSISVTREGDEEPLPPDPSTVAPTLPTTFVTPMADATSFLYTGADPIQRDFTPGAVEPVQAAVVRGRVLNREGAPLPGARVEIKDHPELGYTLSRLDGGYDLAVNGGGAVTLNFVKSGVLPAQRTVDVPWQDYVVLDDVRLVELDTAVTTIDLPSLSEPAVARGSVETDADGPRQATLIFEPGTEAVMVMPDGTEQPLSTLSVRATEYTVGEGGLEAMPGALPPMSRYTYALELSADEAVAAGASTVSFSQPVPLYIENFLAFRTGTPIPVGSFDFQKAAWVPMKDGLVIEVVGVQDSLATVDTDDDGLPEDDASLEAIGLDTLERATLAATYAPGTQLWRAEMTHFSPHDLNLPGGPRGDEAFPDRETASTDSLKAENPKAEHCEELGRSIIECENQILGEILPMVGTGAGLNYRSERHRGRRLISIPLVGPVVPDSLIEVVTRIQVAGRVFTDTFPATPNQRYEFVWDGRDAFGRNVTGAARAGVSIGYVYPFEYYRTRREDERTFGTTCSPPRYTTGDFLRIECAFVETSPAKVLVRSRGTNWAGKVVVVENPPEGGLGGWSPDPVHAYDHVAKVLYLGSGGRVRGSDVALSIEVVAGSPEDPGTDGNGNAAVDARLTDPGPVVVLPDGTIIVSRSAWFGDNDVRRIATDGTISLFANTETCNSAATCHDGDVLTEARFQSIEDMKSAPDGSIYIADGGAIRRVSPEGIVTTIVGDYSGNTGGDGGPVSEAGVAYVFAVALGQDGSLFFSDVDFSAKTVHVRRISPDGFVHHVAGGVVPFFGPFSFVDYDDPCWEDDLPASGACLQSVLDLEIGEDGALYIHDILRVLRLRPDGTLQRIAGRAADPSCETLADGTSALAQPLCGRDLALMDGDRPIFFTSTFDPNTFEVFPALKTVDNAGRLITVAGGNPWCVDWHADGCSGNGSARAARLDGDVEGMAIGPDGAIYVTEESLHVVRRIAPRVPGFLDGEFFVASESGSEIYRFDRRGRHLSTIHAATGATLLSMEYDAEGRLGVLVDPDGLRTEVERTVEGSVTAVVGPFGHRTELTEENGLIVGAQNPDGSSTTLSYTLEGLLTSMVDARGGQHTYVYDDLGRLVLDTDPEGGFIELNRTGFPGAYHVEKTTTLGRTTTYGVQDAFDGGDQRQNASTSGLLYGTERSMDGRVMTTLPDGTVTEIEQAPDARWGLQVPFAARVRSTTPGGLTNSVETSRVAVLADPFDAFSLTSQLDSVTVNGRTFVSLFDATTLTTTSTTPEGRTSTTRVDLLGRVRVEKAPGVDSVSYTYDGSGRVSGITQGSRSWSYAYGSDGLLASAIDPLIRTGQFAYDANGRLTTQTLPDGRQVGYGYDAAGNLTSVTPPGRPAHAFTYDGVNQATEYRPPSVDTWDPATTYTYDLDRALAQVLRPDGIAIDFTYDAAGRVSDITFPGGLVQYGYDPVTGNLTGVNGPYGGALATSYDGSLPTEVEWIGEVSGTVGASYDNDFRLAGLAVNGTDTIAFGYDDDGLLTSAGALAVAREAATGRVSGTTLGSLSTAQTYNASGELASFGANHGGAGLLDFTYTRDALGRTETRTETMGGVSTTFAYDYDTAGRLTEVRQDGLPIEAYSYDNNGNRIQETTPAGTVTGTYDAQDRLGSYGAATFTYTHNGELTARIEGTDTTHYTYDVLGNLLGVDLPDGTAIDYVVDAVGRRIGRKVGGVLEKGWLYQDGLNPVAELDGTGAVVSRFVYGTRGNVPEYMDKAGTTHRIVADELGSVRLVVEVATGTVVQELRYDAWGRVLLDTNPGFQPFGYAGGMYDPATGLVRFGARDYDAEIGRWTSKDPIGFAGGGANLWIYVGSDPINRVDILGLCRIQVGFGPALSSWFPFSHAYVLVTDLDGTQTVARGGPALGAANLTPAGFPGPFPFILDAEVTPYPESKDFPGRGSKRTWAKDVLSDGCPCDPYIESLRETEALIDAARFPYGGPVANSNTAAYFFLSNAGLTPPAVPQGVRAPGFGG